MPELHPDHEAVRNVIAQQPVPAVPQPALKQLPPPHVHWLWRILIGIGGLIVVLFLILTVGYLRFGWQRGWLLQPARVIPFPVAIVGNQWISYLGYQQDVPNINDFLTRNQPPDAAASRTIDQNTYTRKVILNKDIGEAILDIIAKQQGVTVSATDIQSTYDQYVAQSGNASDVEQYIRTLYNWSVDQFKTKLIRPQVVQDKIAQKFFEQSKTALGVIRDQLVAKPETFAAVAKQESQDATSAVKGGEVSPMTTKQVDTAYGTSADQVKALKVNDISAVLETANGYEIVQMLKIEPAKNKADGNMYTVRKILKQPDFNAWLSDKVTTTAKKTRVLLFEARFRWNADCGILAKSEPNCTQASESTSTNTNTATNANTNATQ